MIPYLVLGALLGLPLALGLLLRVSVSHLFFALMAGELLGRYFGHDVGSILHSVTRTYATIQYAEVGILILPMLLTALFLKGTISRGKAMLHVAPMIVTGVVLAAFVLPILPADAQEQMRSIEAGRQLLNLSGAIIGGVVAMQLVWLWLLNRVHGGHHKHHGE